MHQSIAILDSGVGGLTVAKQILLQLPQENILYLGDTARAPYGPRSADEVIFFTEQMVRYLLSYNPKMIVIACNTATAVALEVIREMVSIPVVGVIVPGARAAVKTTHTGRVGVIGTEGTVRSRAYEQALLEMMPELEVHSLACPLFVPLVEQGLFDSDEVRGIVESSLEPLMKRNIDSLILGCTHYPFLSKVISEIAGPSMTLISSADETAHEVKSILHDRQIMAQEGHQPQHQFFCSGDPVMFGRIAEAWLDIRLQVTPVCW